jgi:uncharacterized protein (DUF433 family)
MTLTIAPQPVPLTVNEHGDIRVTGTRIGLEHIVEDYNNGATAEEITLRYSTLKLVDVHSIIAYYLNNQDEVGAYIRRQYERAEELDKRYNITENSRQLHERLLARKQQR